MLRQGSFVCGNDNSWIQSAAATTLRKSFSLSIARLPTSGGDSGAWGDILNAFLQVGHTDGGELKIQTWANAAARPASPVTNQIGLNLQARAIERYDGSAWQQVEGGTGIVTLAYAASVATDASLGDVFDLTLTGNATLANPTNGTDGAALKWRIRQDGTGGRTVTLDSKFRLPSSATNPLSWSTAASKMDILAAIYNATDDKWDVVSFVPGY